MKKFNKIITLLLAIFCLLGAGCQPAPETGNTDNNYALFELPNQDKEVLIYGFDELKDFDEITATTMFGLTKPNYDKNFVSQGKGSMEISVEGYGEILHFPETVDDRKNSIILYPKYFWKNKDFSDALSFRFDVFNDSGRAQKITLNIKTSSHWVCLEPQTVLPGMWTTCDYQIDPERAYYLGMSGIEEILIAFEYRAYGQPPAHYYLDNFRYVKADEKSQRLQTPTFDGTMICDYEDSYFFKTATNISQSAPAGIPYLYPKIEWNEDPEYVTSGSKSLKVTRYPAEMQTGLLPQYFDVSIIHSHYMDTIPFENYNVKQYNIKLDVYLDYSDVLDLTISIASTTVAANKIVTLQPGWNEITYEMDRSDINWAQAAYCNLLMSEFFGWEEAVMYIDNVRFESFTSEEPPVTPPGGETPDEGEEEEEEYKGWNPGPPDYEAIDTTVDFSDAQYSFTQNSEWLRWSAIFIPLEDLAPYGLELGDTAHIQFKVKTNLTYDWCGLFYCGASGQLELGQNDPVEQNTWPYLRKCTEWTETFATVKVTTGQTAFELADAWAASDFTAGQGMSIDTEAVGIFIMIAEHQVGATVAIKDLVIVPA